MQIGQYATANIGRRLFASLPVLALSSGAAQKAAAQDVTLSKEGRVAATGTHYYAYVGCRTTRERNARGDGIQVYRVEAATSRSEHVQLLADLINPSFLALDRTGRFLYTVHGDRSEVSGFRIDPATGKLAKFTQADTKGRNPVHLAIDPTNRFMVVPNHLSSTVAVLPVGEDGTLGPVSDLVKLEGQPGPHRVEQPFAKPHQTQFDPAGRFIIVPDKGLDRVFTFRLEGGKLVAANPPSVQAREASGPRHIAFHPTAPRAYVVNELDSTVTAYRYDIGTGGLTPFQIIPTLPEDYTGDSRASEIAVSGDGRFAYASNRGFDSVAVFAVAPGTGWLTPAEYAPSMGKAPRFFALDPTGHFMFVANEQSDTIVKFEVDQAGKLAATDDVLHTGSPVCIVFRPAI